MKGQIRIEQMYAYVVVDDDNTEGIPAFESSGMAYPMVGADMERAYSLRPVAEQMANDMGKKVTLVRFIQREELEVIEPKGGNGGTQAH